MPEKKQNAYTTCCIWIFLKDTWEKNLTCFEGNPGTFHPIYNYVVVYCNFPLLAYLFIPSQGEGVAASCSTYKRVREKPEESHVIHLEHLFLFCLRGLVFLVGKWKPP